MAVKSWSSSLLPPPADPQKPEEQRSSLSGTYLTCNCQFFGEQLVGSAKGHLTVHPGLPAEGRRSPDEETSLSSSTVRASQLSFGVPNASLQEDHSYFLLSRLPLQCESVCMHPNIDNSISLVFYLAMVCFP